MWLKSATPGQHWTAVGCNETRGHNPAVAHEAWLVPWEAIRARLLRRDAREGGKAVELLLSARSAQRWPQMRRLALGEPSTAVPCTRPGLCPCSHNTLLHGQSQCSSQCPGASNQASALQHCSTHPGLPADHSLRYVSGTSGNAASRVAAKSVAGCSLLRCRPAKVADGWPC